MFYVRLLVGLVIVTLLSLTTVRAESYKLVTFTYPPYEYAENGKVDGIAVRIVRAAFDELGHDVSVEVLPWNRALGMVKEGEADAIFTAYKNDERVKFLDYSKTVLMPQTLSVWAKKGSNVSFDGDVSSLSNIPVGLVDGISYGSAVDGAIKSKTLKKLDYSPNAKSNISKLMSGRFDVIVMNKYGAMHHLKNQNGLDQVQELDPPIASVPSYIAFSKKNNLSDLRDQLDAVLQAMIDDGRYQKIIDDYFAE